MKKILLVCCLLMGFTAVSRAGTVGRTDSDPREKAKGLQKELRLSDRQTARVADIYQESERKFEKIKKEENGNTDKMMEKIRPLRMATVRKIKAVLTRRQAIKYNELLKDSNSKQANGWGDGWGS